LLFDKATPFERIRVLTKIRGRDGGMSPERFDDLWELFRSEARKIVTQHVIAEAYGLRRRLDSLQYRKDLVWRGAIALLKTGIEEQSCALRDLLAQDGYRKILTEIGPTDAGLIFTAERQKATIITDDDELASWAGFRSVPVILLPSIGLS
jgi:rRNA-processing protein FCF1